MNGLSLSPLFPNPKRSCSDSPIPREPGRELIAIATERAGKTFLRACITDDAAATAILDAFGPGALESVVEVSSDLSNPAWIALLFADIQSKQNPRPPRDPGPSIKKMRDRWIACGARSENLESFDETVAQGTPHTAGEPLPKPFPSPADTGLTPLPSPCFAKQALTSAPPLSTEALTFTGQSGKYAPSFGV